MKHQYEEGDEEGGDKRPDKGLYDERSELFEQTVEHVGLLSLYERRKYTTFARGIEAGERSGVDFNEEFGRWRRWWRCLAELSGEYAGVGAGPAADSLEPASAKISKGENMGLPWVMLDYPRLFGQEDVLAIRTMFWWGHCFSVTLHLKGRYYGAYLPLLRERGGIGGGGFSCRGIAETNGAMSMCPRTMASG